MKTPQKAIDTTTTQPNHFLVQPQNLTTPQAAAYLNVQPTTLEQWRWSGRGPRFIKLGRACRYRLVDLNAYMESRSFSSTTEAQRALEG